MLMNFGVGEGTQECHRKPRKQNKWIKIQINLEFSLEAEMTNLKIYPGPIT